MEIHAISLENPIRFKIRFNTSHGDTDLYWRVIVEESEYLVRNVNVMVSTFSESSFDPRAGVIKFHIAGFCHRILIDDDLVALFINDLAIE